jgi:hypothetical protein
MSGSRAARLAKHHLYELTDLEPEAVSGLARRESGWLVSIEVVESPRIPSTADLLGSYHVEIDDAGELTECRRVRRYFRNQAGQE